LKALVIEGDFIGMRMFSVPSINFFIEKNPISRKTFEFADIVPFL
jgi:hypothetical protein